MQTNHQPMGFIGAPNNLPYPPGNNLPYPAPNMPSYPVNNHPMPSTSTASYPPYPYAPHVPIPPNVHTTQPTANTVIIQEQKLESGNSHRIRKSIILYD